MRKARKRNAGIAENQDIREQNAGPKEVDIISQASPEAAKVEDARTWRKRCPQPRRRSSTAGFEDSRRTRARMWLS